MCAGDVSLHSIELQTLWDKNASLVEQPCYGSGQSCRRSHLANMHDCLSAGPVVALVCAYQFICHRHCFYVWQQMHPIHFTHVVLELFGALVTVQHACC